MVYKQVLTIREPMAFQQDITKTSEHKIKTWCCINQGDSRIDVQFPKNIFYPNEICESKILLDNSKCQIAMTNVRLAIEQAVNLRAPTVFGGARTFNDLHTLI